MKHINLRNAQQFNGGFTDLFVVGVDQVQSQAAPYSKSSDFTAAGTSQTIALTDLAIGDIVLNHAVLYVKTKLAGTSLSAAAASVGVTGATTQFLNAVDVYTNATAAGGTFVSGAPSAYATQAASKQLLLTMATTGCNLSALTAGELWIYAKLTRIAEFLTNRQA